MAQQCEGIRKDGVTRCSKWVMSDEAWSKWEQRILAVGTSPEMRGRLCYGCAVGGWESAKLGLPRRKRKVVSTVEAVYGFETVLRVIAEALTAEINEPGFRGPDWDARLAAVALLIECQPDWMRESPQEARWLLDRMLPERLERPSPEAAYRALAAAKARLRERGHPLTEFAGANPSAHSFES
jgi:hypothetical protein